MTNNECHGKETTEVQVCDWAIKTDSEREYHDLEWGVPLYDDTLLFEFICLEGAQAGLSWRTILNKREAYRAAFDGFDIDTLLQYDESRVPYIIENFGIVRNKLKIASVFNNAKAAKALQQEYGTLSQALWQFVDNKPIQNNIADMASMPVSTDESKAMSKFLKKKGFKFVGETICYALMQAVGMINDHIVNCPEHKKCQQLG